MNSQKRITKVINKACLKFQDILTHFELLYGRNQFKKIIAVDGKHIF